MLDLHNPDRLWMLRGRCLSAFPDAWFPDNGVVAPEIKRVCGGCPVRVDCLEYALVHDERFGIWGGLSERQRKRMRQGKA